jgi:outer membrane protein TolC
MRCPTIRGKRRLVSLHLVSLILFSPVADHVSIAQQNSPVHLSLNQAIDLAIKQNRSVHLRSLAVEDMHSKKDEARSNYMPQLKTSGGIHHVTELAGVEIPASAFGNFPSTGSVPAKSLFIDQGSDTAYTGGVELDQPLTQLLRIHQANVAAEQDVLVAQTQLSQAQADVALNVRKLYYDILINQQELQASQEQLEAMKLKDSEAHEDVAHGNALEIATFQTKASILEAQQKALTLKLQGEDFKRELADLLGLPVGKQIDLDPDIPAQSIDLPSCSEATRIALEQNQDIRAARHLLEKAKAELAAAKDAYIPDITASSRYSYQSGVPLLEHNFGTFGFNLSFDLFDGGRREAQVRDARTAVTSAQVTIDRLESEISVEIQTEYDRVEELKEMVGVVQQALEVRKEAARLADQQFEQNALLAAARSQGHADLSNATALLLEANLNLSLAEVEVEKTIGQIPR